jgi:hypothetical protein
MIRRIVVLLAALALPSVAQAQNGSFIQYTPPALISTGAGAFALPGVSGGLSLYNLGGPGTTDYERATVGWSANDFTISFAYGGAGTSRALKLNAFGSVYVFGALYPMTADSTNVGIGTLGWKTLGLTRSIEGSKSKALSDNAATTFVSVAIPQTAGANYAGGQIIYTIFCKDATNQAEQSGLVAFACHNRAGTETCGFETPHGVTLGDGTASLGTPAFTAAGGADLVVMSVQSDCTGVTPTTQTIQYRLDMPQPNGVTPQ